MRKASDAKEKAEAETADRARAWDKTKDKEKTEIARLDDEVREKADPEAKETSRAKEKYIVTKRVASEAGAETGVRVEDRDEVRDKDAGIMTEILNKIKDTLNGLKRKMVGDNEKTK